MDPQGKVALITGGASGIGLACVEELLTNGAHVSVCDKNADVGKAVMDNISKKFGDSRAIFIEMDVQDQNSFKAAFKKTIDTFNGLDIVINNAGVGEFGDWEATISINLGGVARGTMLAMEHMDKNVNGKGGVVINIASVAGLQIMASCPIYVASKHAVIGLSRSYGMPFHFNRTGVRVLAVCPGVTDTPLLATARSLATSNSMVAERLKILDKLPHQNAEDVAKGVVHVIRHAANGSVWVSEGGELVYEVRFPHREEMKIST
ncbi:15-hydroxyprostaglandin dehydrogenase [NAD(+)] [Anabrus simplex]|uniref:15-hydroxyprostaglandin dehydrogenase [NAD(+)] n=1 Tax=Anabrus simplex TaxID=316456 RepID=UPI0035A2794D